MSEKLIRIIYNNDFTESGDKYVLDGRVLELDNNISGTVKAVEDALKAAGFTVSVIPLHRHRSGSLDGFIKDLKSSDSIVFNLCEGAFGKSYFEMHVAALLELYGIRFTGNGPLTLGMSLNKALTKDILRSRGVPTAGHCVMESPSSKIPALKYPLIIKPLKEDASIGIDQNAVVHSEKELKKRVEFITKEYSQPAIVEEYIDGREFNIGVLGAGKGAKALPPSEIVFRDFPEGASKICCYEAKWVVESPFYNKTVPVCPAPVTKELGKRLESISLMAYEAMGCRDYARVDIRVGSDGDVRVLEVNPNPDISPDAGLARAARAFGLDYPGLISAVVAMAEARYEALGSAKTAANCR